MPLIDVQSSGALAAGKLTAILAEKLRAHNAAVQGSSRQIRRFAVMTQGPSLDTGEITDKGSINQRASLTQRHAMVAMLYAEPPPAGVTLVDLG
jgi:feruloyl-CoA synthase